MPSRETSSLYSPWTSSVALQGADSLLPEPLRSVEKTKSWEERTQMDEITSSNSGSWAFLVGRGPGSFSRLVAMLASHGPWLAVAVRSWCATPGARLAPSSTQPWEHKLLFTPLTRLFSGLRVWRRTVDSPLSKEFPGNLNNMEHSVPLLPRCCVCPSHGWFSSKEYLLLFNNAVVYRHNSWLNRKHTGWRPSKEIINRLCLEFKKKKIFIWGSCVNKMDGVEDTFMLFLEITVLVDYF